MTPPRKTSGPAGRPPRSATAQGAGLGKVAQPVRVAVAGGSVSPPIDVALEILGRDVTLARIDRAIERSRGGQAVVS